MRRGWRRVAIPYGRWRVRRNLDGLHVFGLANATDALSQGAVTFASTHVSWWDGVLMVVLDDVLDTQARFLMDEANLSRLPFFRAIGAIGIDRSTGAGSRHALTTAKEHLTAPGHAVWIFPQGRQRPRHVRPLGLYAGVQMLARSSGGTVVPVTLNYGFRESHLPTAVVTFEPALPGDCSLDDLEAAMIRGIERADRFLDGDTTGFDTLIGNRSTRIDAGLGSRLLAWVSRG